MSADTEMRCAHTICMDSISIPTHCLPLHMHLHTDIVTVPGTGTR